MRPRTTTAVALAGAALAAPAAALAAQAVDDPPSPERTALRAPLAGHLTVAAQMRAERQANLRADLRSRAIRQARRTAKATGEDFSGRAERRRLRGESVQDLRERIRELRRERRAAVRRAAPAAPAGASTASPALEAIAACESGGDTGAIGGGGAYRGKYQFSPSTWASVGGSGDPAAASEAEQDMRAQMLYEREGAAPWPVCGR